MGTHLSKKKVVDKAIYMIDEDMDNSASVLKQIIKPNKGAFSKPSTICKLIDEYPDDEVIRLVLTTYGGALVHCEKILKKLLNHKSGYIAYIRNECYSAGAMIALGANEIVMNSESYIGKIDPQNGNEAMVIYATLEDDQIDSKNIYKVEEARTYINYMKDILGLIYEDDERIENIMDLMVFSKLPHCKLFDFEECVDKLNLAVRKPLKNEKKYFTNNIEVKNYKKK